MKRMVKIFFVYVLIHSPLLGAFQRCGWKNTVDEQEISLEKCYQQVRIEHQITIVCMLALLESNKLLLLQILEHQTDFDEQTITLQSLRETEWKINVMRERLTRS